MPPKPRPPAASALTRYAALLRGVSPTNVKMPALQAAFEAAGFADVRTVLASGNVVFRAPAASEADLERAAEAAMQRALGRTFTAIVRPIDALAALLAADPWRRFTLPPDAKRVVSFLRAAPRPAPALPIELDGARILAIDDRAVFTAYVRHPKGPVFMTLLERTFGDAITTRTRDTIEKLTRLP
jgi:uncharacterized protein (DUF1697 family)